MTQETVIGPQMQLLFATASVLYGLNPNDAKIYQYQGTPNQWLAVSDPAKQFVTNEFDFYRLDANGDVSLFQGNTGTEVDLWLKIGENMSSLIAGGPALYGINSSNGNILRYEGSPMGWTEIGGPGYQFVTNGKHLFGISPGQQNVYQYVDTPPDWIKVGGAANYLFITGNALYAIANDDGDTLLRYEGNNTWLKVGQGWSQFAYLGLSLYAISKDGTVVGEFDGTPGNWTQFAGSASAIAADSRSVFLSDNKGTYEYDIITDEDGENMQQGTVQERTASSPGDWIWSFKTSDSYFAGYDGKIEMTLFSTGSFEQEITLPRNHFERGRTYFMMLDVDNRVLPLRGISLGGEENFFDDQWNLDSATGYDPDTFTLYNFDVHQKIPNSETIFVVPTTQTVHVPPSGYVTVFVWNYLGKDVAWGHASLQLSTGTYISWWPQGQNRQSMPLLPQVYTVDAYPNQTYADDVNLEFGHEPDWRLIVGGLDESKIQNWWQGFKTTHQWSTLVQNCSTTVADALWAGGASGILTSRERDNLQAIVWWTPNDALLFAQALMAH